MWCGSDKGRERLRSESDCSVYDEEYRIVVLGCQDVGKTAICQVYVGGKAEEDHCNRMALHKSASFHRAEFCTWDTVDGQTSCMRVSELRIPVLVRQQTAQEDPIFKSLTQRADGFLLVYSVTDQDSFRSATEYYHLVMQLRSFLDTPLVFIAHKTDCVVDQVITSSKGRDAAFTIGASFYETSIRSDPEGVKFVFHDVIRQVRSVRQHSRTQEQPCNRMRGFIHRLSLRSRKKHCKSRQKLKSIERSASSTV